ncbi:MAG: ABC transporter substrate-binding protein [Inquilinaceae bacterium]
MRTTTLLGLSATAAYGIAGGAVAPAAQAQEPQSGGTLRVSMFVQEMSDPATYDWSQKANVARQVIESLTIVGPDNITRPHLAAGWEASEDLKTWTFRLQPNARWNNGDDFIAEDVIYNFERWLDPETGSSNKNRFAAVEAVEKVDDKTVRFTLSTADLALPESMGDYPALLVHRNFQADGGNLVENPIGTGPFLLTEFSVGERAVLTRRPAGEWWGGEVYLDSIVYIDHGDDPAAGLAALASGQVDLLDRLNVDQVPAVANIPNLVLYEVVTAQTGVARMKVTEPPFDNVLVRKAVRACIDHDRILELAYQGRGQPGEDHHVAPVHPEYVELPKPQQDYDEAKRLLAEAGYADGLDITIDCVAAPAWEPNTCQVIAEMLRPAGINLSVNIMPGGTYWDRWMTAPFGFTSWTSRPLGVQVLNVGYRSGAEWNESSYSNPEFDAQLDLAMGIIDADERRVVMERLERILQDDSVIIQPYWRAIATAGSQNVKGFEIQPSYEHHFHKVWLA